EGALSHDRPGVRGRAKRAAADDARAVHVPAHHLPGGGVAPKDVAPAVKVDIMGRGESRPEETRRDETSCAPRQRAKQSPKSRSRTHVFPPVCRNWTDGPNADRVRISVSQRNDAQCLRADIRTAAGSISSAERPANVRPHTTPAVVIRPILLPTFSVNHHAP